MHNYRSNGDFGKKQWINNSVILEEYVDYNTYNLWIPASTFVEITGTTAPLSVRDSCPVRVFADGVNYTVVNSFRKPTYWASGIVSAKVFYTGSSKPSSDVLIGIGIQACERGDSIPSLSTYELVSKSPDVDGEIVICDDWYTTNEDIARCRINQNDSIVFVAFNRNGGDGDDTNDTDIELVGVEVYYIESPHEVSFNSSKMKIESRSFGTIKEI